MIIYKVTNKQTNQIYIGQTIRNFSIRKAEHLRTAQQLHRQKYPTPLHSAINQYGSSEFEWEILETCESLDQLNEREKHYIKELNCLEPNGYNQTTGGAMDSTMSEKTRFKIAESVKELHKNPVYTNAIYPKLKGRTPSNKGIPMSEEQKAKVSAARKAVHNDPEYINPNTGMKREGKALENVRKGHTRRKMPKGEAWSKAHGKQYTPEVREKMRQAKLGKKPANTHKIQCIETGQIFEGLTAVSLALDINRQSVYLQLKGKLKKVGNKYTFKYFEEYI